MCIAQKSTINQTNRITSNPELYFKNSDQMKELFNDIPEITKNNFLISMKCNFFPKEISPKLPKFSNDKTKPESEILNSQSKKGLRKRIKEKNILDFKKYEERLEYELNIINNMGFAGYFLIVSDFVI